LQIQTDKQSDGFHNPNPLILMVLTDWAVVECYTGVYSNRGKMKNFHPHRISPNHRELSSASPSSELEEY